MSIAYFGIFINGLTPILLVCCIIFLLYYVKEMIPAYLYVSLYLVLALLASFTMTIVGKIFGNNLIIIPLFGFFELIFFYILYVRFMDISRFRLLLSLLFVASGSYMAYECLTIDVNDVSSFQSYSRTIASFIIVLFSMIYFFDKLTKGTDPSDSGLKLNTIILIFFSFNLIYFLPLNFLVGKNSQLLKFYFWFGYSCFFNLFYIYLTHAIWKNGRILKH